MATKSILAIIASYGDVLEHCGIFDKVPREKYPNVLSCLQAKILTIPKNTTVYAPGEVSRCAGIVLEGVLEKYFYDENGNQLTIDHLRRGRVFGSEQSCSDQTSSQVFLRAASDIQALTLDFRALLTEKTLSCPHRMQITANLMQALARQVLFFTTKVRILSQKKLRDKLKVYLQTQKITQGGVILLPLNRSELAEFLYADRSALSRELCRMRDEGILSVSGAKITVLDKGFLSN